MISRRLFGAKINTLWVAFETGVYIFIGIERWILTNSYITHTHIHTHTGLYICIHLEVDSACENKKISMTNTRMNSTNNVNIFELTHESSKKCYSSSTTWCFNPNLIQTVYNKTEYNFIYFFFSRWAAQLEYNGRKLIFHRIQACAGETRMAKTKSKVCRLLRDINE